MNPLFPYIFQQSQQPILSETHSEQNKVPPYDTKTYVKQYPNPFYGTFPMMPFYDPQYYGLSPFDSFTHFDPFKMPQNPLMQFYAQNQQQ